ncbi:MAG: ABC transporter permease [Geodermatophilaceae bacterium]|nr:ABC transporter permease [Geodermatophilaceae bacterium]
MTPLSFVPSPGAAPMPRMLRAQAGMELRMSLRQGEQVTLTLVLPVLLALALVLTSVVDVADAGTGRAQRADFFLPGVLALAVVSTAFTGQAIATGFERKYGVLKRLGATAMPRAVLLGGKTLAVLGVIAVQLVLLSLLGLALGWRPQGPLVGAVVVIALGTAAFSALGLLLAGTVRAEATLAAANLVWFLLLVLGGLLVPAERLGVAGSLLGLLPSAALADGLRAVLTDGALLPVGPVLVLLVWTTAAALAAGRWFRWE